MFSSAYLKLALCCVTLQSVLLSTTSRVASKPRYSGSGLVLVISHCTLTREFARYRKPDVPKNARQKVSQTRLMQEHRQHQDEVDDIPRHSWMPRTFLHRGNKLYWGDFIVQRSSDPAIEFYALQMYEHLWFIERLFFADSKHTLRNDTAFHLHYCQKVVPQVLISTRW